MDAQVPAVVAVVVTTGSGPWLEDTLASLAAQHYDELSVLVLVAGEADPSEQVGRILPQAFVRQLPGRPGYAEASNEALGMVEGATFFLLCHDDCALDPDAVHNMVEESFRSNAGVVSPKFVNWDDPSILLHVGMHCDKTGAVVDRIQDGEVDHGQHDAVRDVFVAPGGCILIRADLWRELEGFDPGILAMGEDLDLSWRSQVAGSRVVVAPDARVRHREAVASGAVPLAVAGIGAGARPETLQALQRRHELRTVLKCYSWFHLVRVLPQAALLALGEVIVALLARDRSRARAVAGAWWWNAHHLGELRVPRQRLKEHRLFPDTEVRRLQLRGSARLSRYLSRLSHQGFDAANAVASSHGLEMGHRDRPEVPLLTGSVGLAFSEDSDFDELDDLGHRSGRDRFGRQVRYPFLSSGRQRVIAVVVAALVVVVGTRELFFGSLPMVGQLAPLAGWSASWHHFFSGWQPAGVGTTAPATPAYGIVGVVGTVLFGDMALVQKLLVLGCIPLGAAGLSRLMRPLVSPRARVVGAIAYLALPLPYGALGAGRWDGLVAYAALPFIVGRLARAARMAPFDQIAGRGWRSGTYGQIAVLGAVIAAATSFAPAVLPMALVCALALALGTLFAGQIRSTGRVVVTGIAATLVAALLCAPWVIGTALAGRHAVEIFGLPVSHSAVASWGQVVRFAIGPTVRSPLVWLLVAASALPLFVGTGQRFVWAARLWTLALASWVLAVASTRGWTGTFTPSETVVLVPAAIAVAAGIGLGASCFDNELAGRAFGWRQLASGLALVAVIVGVLPMVAGAAGGRWGLPASGVEQPLAFLNRPAPGAYRVLWLGDPRALPVGSWSIEPGLSYALTGEELPDSTEVWTPAGPGPAVIASKSVRLAISGGTVHLGRLLAGQSVRFVVVVDGLAPSADGLTHSVAAPPPAGLERAMLDQDDLQIVPGEFGVQVYRNAMVIPVMAHRSRPVPPSTRWSWPGAQAVTGWQPVLSRQSDHPEGRGVLTTGTVYEGYAPAGSFALQSPGGNVPRRSAFGWAEQYRVSSATTATFSLRRFPIVPLGVALEVLCWLALIWAALGWRRRAARLARP